ncbi:hypothetical protein [Acidobacterium sp. S8]|uniref:hypothetical protein n=1 Tax=Acidobacterium sp. S8 TaxID=1641854 RepID=UPI00131C53FF|nr:hypothetical protein [Acidobacterium sp. S8]
MENLQTIRKLVPFATLVVVLAGVPHFLLDRKPRVNQTAGRSYEYLLPEEIGQFHVLNRWKNAIEQGAIYQDRNAKQVVQFDIRINSPGSHDGLSCYLARGMSLQSLQFEHLQTADSTANFEVDFIGDQSLNGLGHSVLFIALTQCDAEVCTQVPAPLSTGLQVTWLRPAKVENDVEDPRVVPLSITFQSFDAEGPDQALLQFRELMSNFKLVPLRELSVVN